MRSHRMVLSRIVATGAALVSVAAAWLPSMASAGAETTASAEVTTDKGVVIGSNDGTVRSFYGIPFAAPPTGAGRWASPQPAAKWTAPRQATAPGHACTQ